jgi:hypothetical protein
VVVLEDAVGDLVERAVCVGAAVCVVDAVGLCDPDGPEPGGAAEP